PILDLLAERFLARPEPLHEALVHDDHLAVEFNVLLAHLPSAQNGNAEGGKGIRADISVVDHHIVAIRRMVAFDLRNSQHRPSLTEWFGAGYSDPTNARDERNPPDNLRELRHHGVGGVTYLLQVERRDGKPRGSEANVHRQLFAHAAQAERSAAKEHERSDDLRDDQAMTQPRPFSIRSVATFRILERGEWLETGRAQRREETEAGSHQQRTADGKKKESQVESRVEIRPLPPGCKLRDDPADPGEGKQSAGCPERRDQNALADKLTHQRAASGAERQAGRHLPAALQCPRQKQTRHIGARDEKQ